MNNKFNKKEIKIIDGEMYYYGFNLVDLAKKYGTPLKITFLDLIKDRINELKSSFDSVIEKEGYKGKFIYLNANKANYGGLEIKEALEHADGIETSSYLDLVLSSDLINKYAINKLLYSNGYKDDNYLKEILKVNKSNIDYTCIIDSIDEYEFLKKHAKNLKIGLRVHLPALYSEEGEVIKNDRFGLMNDEIDYILSDLANNPNLILSTIHFHQRGMEFEKDKFLKNIHLAFENYYVKAAKLYDSVINFDMGGGTPLSAYRTYDYNEFASVLIKELKSLASIYNVKEPNIISENGRYTVKDSVVNVYKVVAYKETDRDFNDPKNTKKFYPWYILDASLLIALPEMYALGEEILIEPINNLNNEMIEARLSSITCDCDDVYYEKDKGFIELPKLEGNDQYVGLLGTGSYQNSMNGKGGVHHCLLPEEKDLVIYTKNNKLKFLVRSELQSYDDIKKLMKLDIEK